ncbi:helix-turn-helix domain-containing protein [Pelagicoccus mobilis]|uniref:Helix-turn-helix transcriptional regulator n=1 Tax=Pelagicoccus mobilis TaxID=415221 RepID=A0A934RQS7_9BACT|nr:AraC family transcriptional regulator [Pelagicoccus mobilis]MBK1875830.1 helix-turn-helix transcriptional regulator [Pelagicoccus mobilis]
MIAQHLPQRNESVKGEVEKADYYTLELENTSHDQLRVVGGGKEHCEPNFCQNVVEAPFYGIEYIVSGSCILERNGIAETLTAGSLFAYSPRDTYVLRNANTQPLVKHFINFEGNDASLLVENKALIDFQTPNLIHHKWVERTFVSLQECGMGGCNKRQAACKHLLLYLSTRLSDTSQSEMDTTYVSASRSNFDNICRYIEENYARITSPLEVANTFNISHQYLCFLFKKFSNETPTKMVTRFKLARAVELLRERTLLIKQIAEQVGFVDQYYFSKCFKGYYGLSPRKFLNRSALRISA